MCCFSKLNENHVPSRAFSSIKGFFHVLYHTIREAFIQFRKSSNFVMISDRADSLHSFGKNFRLAYFECLSVNSSRASAIHSPTNRNKPNTRAEDLKSRDDIAIVLFMWFHIKLRDWSRSWPEGSDPLQHFIRPEVIA
jgi:hypothetical protein